MAQVLVRDLDSEVLDRLRKRASRNHRSLEAELRSILTEASQTDIADFRVEVERIREMFAGRTFSDSGELQREDRER